MQLVIDGEIDVYLERLPSPNSHHVLQVEILNAHLQEGFHGRLVESLRKIRGSDTVTGEEFFTPGDKRFGTSEILIIDGLELEFIDLCRLLGYGVTQCNYGIDEPCPF